MQKPAQQFYSEKESPFYKLSTRRKLADLLFVSMAKLNQLKRDDSLYYSFQKKKKSGGFRKIDAPRTDLKVIQRRIADLLQRIAPPDFLFSPVVGRSYVDNAARHLGATAFGLLDVEDFFPHCTADKVIWLFRTRLRCPIDVAVILRKLVTHNGALPQGSPCSPILAYLCYVEMWDEIYKAAERYGCTLSVYADDITLSGRLVPAMLLHTVKRILRKHGHRHSIRKERSLIHRPARVTGAIVWRGRLALPNQQHQKLYDLRKRIRKASSEQDALSAQLRGRRSQLSQIQYRNNRKEP